MVNKAIKALIIGGAIVCVAGVVGRMKIATPIPFLMLLPGLFAGACVPGSGFNLKDDSHPWSALAICVVIVVDVAIYGGLVYGYLSYRDRIREGSNF